MRGHARSARETGAPRRVEEHLDKLANQIFEVKHKHKRFNHCKPAVGMERTHAALRSQGRDSRCRWERAPLEEVRISGERRALVVLETTKLRDEKLKNHLPPQSEIVRCYRVRAYVRRQRPRGRKRDSRTLSVSLSKGCSGA